MMNEDQRNINRYGHVVFLTLQVTGLLFLHWNGLYVIYLCWIDLFLLSVYTYLRNKQYQRTREWIYFKERRRDLFNEEPSLVVFMRLLSMSFYLFAIGITVIPYERSFLVDETLHPVHKYYEVRSINQFFDGLLIHDPLFILAIFFAVFYYMKLLMSKVDVSEQAMIEFSFCRSYKDPRYLAPFLAICTFVVPAMFMYAFYEEDSETISYLYFFAVWLLLFMFTADVLLGRLVKSTLSSKGHES